ncbi:hypothetical protein H072_5776 [Dactylellina haptotyla CBS 200.50]|uniref:Uncharacterized protein n=1 Tax=Dactylellina haptotyla (strain CBS 200.50) TaxID=1284197 RepID=S8BYJ4_DACHA|nr:hypothetical protein H072_5776 [Dactylellina haptotyla CBS 200.50]
MKSAGIPKWEAIKVRVDGMALPNEPHSSLVRQSSIGWGRSQEPPQIEKAPVIPPSNSKAGAISNPSPLPLDPTLQPSKRRNQISRDGKSSTGRSFLQSDSRITTSGMLKTQNSDGSVTGVTATSQRGTSKLDIKVSSSVHQPDTPQEPYSSASSHHNPNIEYKDASTSAAQEQSLLDPLDNSTLILPDSNLPDTGPASLIAGTGYANHQNHCSGDKVSNRESKTEKSGSRTDGVSSGLADAQMEESSVTNAVPKITYNLATGGATISNASHKSAAGCTEPDMLDATKPSKPQLSEKPWWKLW